MVIWSDVLGGVQCWEDPLPSCGPTHSTEDGEGGAPAGAPRQPSMPPRDVSTAQQSLPLFLLLFLYILTPTVHHDRYDVMKMCWMTNHRERPSFTALVQAVDKTLMSVAGYMELSMTLTTCIPDVDPVSEEHSEEK